jgi:5-(carboxyamino)imidazole ribonucleotide mutase
MSKVILILGSNADKSFASQIEGRLAELFIDFETHVASAHKTPKAVLEILEQNEKNKVIYITIAGRSNALSGFCAGNTSKPVIACPPFADKTDMLVNVHSSLQMPSQVPVMTILDPGNAALAAARILQL